MRSLLTGFLILLFSSPAWTADLAGKWELAKADLTYRVTHPLHKVVGKSSAAKGKGECSSKSCEFLVAVPVKSFDSGDGNRDSHMWQTVKAGLHPMIQVRLKNLKGAASASPREVVLDAEVDFAGSKVSYAGLKLTVAEWKKEGVRLKGVLPLSLKAYGIPPPSLLAIPIQDSVPVEMDLTWKRR